MNLTGLRLYGRHGVLPEEAVRPQPFVVDVELHLDLRRAAERDDLGETVNYAEVARLAAEVVGGTRRRLIESLAGAIAQRLLEAFPIVRGGVVVVHKPEAPVSLPFADVSVRYPFSRPSRARSGRPEVERGARVPFAGE